jgi:hypothetical protein
MGAWSCDTHRENPEQQLLRVTILARKFIPNEETELEIQRILNCEVDDDHTYAVDSPCKRTFDPSNGGEYLVPALPVSVELDFPEPVEPDYHSNFLLDVDTLTREIFDTQNKLRTDPLYFKEYLEKEIAGFDENSIVDEYGLVKKYTHEGVTAWQEALDKLTELANQAPLSPFIWDDAFALSARHHCANIGSKGTMSYEGINGSTPKERVLEYGEGEVGWENLVFGIKPDANTVVMSLFIDDGNTNRAHRSILLSEELKLTGVAHCPWKTIVAHFETWMAVIDYGKSFHSTEEARIDAKEHARIWAT